MAQGRCQSQWRPVTATLGSGGLGVPTQIPTEVITGCPCNLGSLSPGADRQRGRSDHTARKWKHRKEIQVILLAACDCAMNKEHPSVEGQWPGLSPEERVRGIWDIAGRDMRNPPERTVAASQAKVPGSVSRTAVGAPAQTGRSRPLKSTNHSEFQGHRAPLNGASSRQSEATGRSSARAAPPCARAHARGQKPGPGLAAGEAAHARDGAGRGAGPRLRDSCRGGGRGGGSVNRTTTAPRLPCHLADDPRGAPEGNGN